MKDRHKITNLGSSENIKKNKYKKNLHLGISSSDYRKPMTEKILKETGEKKHPTFRGIKTRITADFLSKIHASKRRVK